MWFLFKDRCIVYYFELISGVAVNSHHWCREQSNALLFLPHVSSLFSPSCVFLYISSRKKVVTFFLPFAGIRDRYSSDLSIFIPGRIWPSSTTIRVASQMEFPPRMAEKIALPTEASETYKQQDIFCLSIAFSSRSVVLYFFLVLSLTESETRSVCPGKVIFHDGS